VDNKPSHTLIRAKSPEIDSSITKLRPPKVLVSLGREDISTTSSPVVGERPYLMGNPPCWIMVPYAVLVKNAGMPAPRDGEIRADSLFIHIHVSSK
jgi:hypothetical protein